MKTRRIMSVLTSAVLTSALFTAVPVTAEDEENKSNWTTDVISMTMRNVTEDGVRTQWYTCKDDQFRAEGLTVNYMGEDVSGDCTVNFPYGVTPANAYDGKNLEYEFPVDITYGDNTMAASIITKIGEPGDANTDCSVDSRDSALIARDIRTHTPTKNSALTAFGRFLTTGNRNEKVYDLTADHASGIAEKLAQDAIRRAKRGKPINQQTESPYSLTLSKAVGIPGQEVVVQVVVGTGNTFESLDAVIEWEGDGYIDLDPALAAGGTNIASISDGDIVAIVDYGDRAVKDGAVASLKFKIPEDAVPGQKYGLGFSEVKTFSVLGKNGKSKNIADKINIRSSSVQVMEPKATTAAPATTAVTTTATKTTTTKTTTTKKTGSGATTTAKAMPNMIKAEINNPPEKTEFEEGESTDLAGMEVSLYYINGADGKKSPICSNANINDYPDLFSISIEEAKSRQSGGKYNLVLSPSEKAVQDVKKKYSISSVNVQSDHVPFRIYPWGDANHDCDLSIRDASLISKKLSLGKVSDLPRIADYNQDGVINIRDAAAIAMYLSSERKI